MMDYNNFSKQLTPQKTEKENPFLKKIDADMSKKVDDYVDQIEILEDNPLQTTQMKREKIRQEIKDAVKLVSLNEQIELGLKTLIQESPNYLTEDVYQKLISDFSQVISDFENLETQSEIEKTNLFHSLSEESIESIIKVAVAKLKEENFSLSLSLFTLLTILNPENEEYWLRMGMSAQMENNFELANKAYAAVMELNPKHIGACLFAAECLLERQLIEEAKAQVAAGRSIAAAQEVEPDWLELLSAIEKKLAG